LGDVNGAVYEAGKESDEAEGVEVGLERGERQTEAGVEEIQFVGRGVRRVSGRTRRELDNDKKLHHQSEGEGEANGGEGKGEERRREKHIEGDEEEVGEAERWEVEVRGEERAKRERHRWSDGIWRVEGTIAWRERERGGREE